MALCLLLAAFNLRPALTSLATMLAEIQASLHVSGFWTGVLTTAPVLCFGIFGPLAPLASSRLGLEKTTALLLLLLAAGLALRTLPDIVPLVTSAIMAGAAIGMIGVLLPVIIRRDFSHRLGLVTGLYTMTLSFGGAIGAGFTPVAAHAGTWTLALAAWGLPALAGALLWSVLAKRQTGTTRISRITSFSILLRDPIAWHVTAFMGLQAALAFIVLGWLPTLLLDRGLGVIDAGFVTSTSIISQLATALLVPMLAARRLSPSLLVLLVLGATGAGFLGLLYAPLATRFAWAVLLGLGQGGLFGLALLFISLRSPSPEAAAMLSSMSQSIGYLAASAGPFAVSVLRDFSIDTTMLFLAITLVAAWSGWQAAKPRYVLRPSAGAPAERAPGGVVF
ncbi:MFS transporter [Microvirga terricola]|uniref:MFS transporter n=1 Tax=Microvirga terricola TaxID=2719797 RepID=A0ABX0VHF4_9HYPH|nr:MFS transporter [Microvirga terricola]NIX78330.1 MFS transporter [Microvirga terricola]